MSEERKNSRLGKGLSALIGEYDTFEAPEGASDSAKEIQMLRMAQVRANPQQPRKKFDEKKLAELTASVKAHGVLTPILVREVDHADYKFQIIAGERRFRASKAAELEEIPARILKTNDLQLLEIGLIENVQREDLNAMEEAEGYQALMSRFGKTQETVAESVGKSRAHVANMLRLLNLPESVRDHLRAGDITAGHARAALASDDPDTVVEQVMARKLSVRETEALVRKMAAGDLNGKGSAKAIEEKDVDTEALEADLSRALGLVVDIKAKANGGEIKIKYRDLEQLDDICRRLSRN